MDCDFKGNWGEIKAHMEAWWAHEDFGRPVLAMIVPRVKDAGAVSWSESSAGENPEETKRRLAVQVAENDYEAYWTDYDVLMARQKT